MPRDIQTEVKENARVLCMGIYNIAKAYLTTFDILDLATEHTVIMFDQIVLSEV